MQTAPLYLARRLPWTLIAVLLGGCGGDRGPQRVVVSGTVAYQGKPIAAGTIQFLPVSASLPGAAALIVDGKYKLDNKGGVPVGTHKIVIEAYKNDPDRGEQGGAPVGRHIRQNYLPSCCNGTSQLQITIEAGSRGVTQDFDLK